MPWTCRILYEVHSSCYVSNNCRIIKRPQSPTQAFNHMTSYSKWLCWTGTCMISIWWSQLVMATQYCNSFSDLIQFHYPPSNAKPCSPSFLQALDNYWTAMSRQTIDHAWLWVVIIHHSGRLVTQANLLAMLSPTIVILGRQMWWQSNTCRQKMSILTSI